MLHHPHVIAPHGKRTMTLYIAPSDCRLNNQLCTVQPQYLGTAIVHCLFSAPLHLGDVCVLVCVGAVEVCGAGNNIIGEVRHVGAVMTYH
jgi:hypothetical protein